MNKQDISDIYYDKVHVTRDRYRSLYSYQDDATLCTYFYIRSIISPFMFLLFKP